MKGGCFSASIVMTALIVLFAGGLTSYGSEVVIHRDASHMESDQPKPQPKG